MFTIKFDIVGLEELILKMEQLEDDVRNGPGMPVMQQFGNAGMVDIDERFNSGGYGTWAPLSPITIAKKGGRTTILIDTANMKGSVGIGQISTNRVSVTVPYGGKKNSSDIPARHQLGEPDKNLPQRKIVEVTEQLMERVRPIFRSWYMRWQG